MIHNYERIKLPEWLLIWYEIRYRLEEVKKKLFFAVLIIIALPIIFLICFRDNSELEEGIYRIQDNELYPDAYILVQDNSIQFCNIDLNTIFKDEMVERYIFFQENEYGKLTDKEKMEIDSSIDLNKLLCEQPYQLNYETQIKEGWNEFSNMFCKINSINSFGYLYHADTKTIFIDGASTQLSFKK